MSRERPGDAPAPVVTDEGVYGTLPPLALRDLERAEGRRNLPVARVLAALFALVAGLWLVSVSVSQATSRTVAIPTIARTLDAMVGLPGHVMLHADEIRRLGFAAAAPSAMVAVPGLDMPGAQITSAEVRFGGPADWYQVLRLRMAEAAYQDGMGALQVVGGAPPSRGGAFTTSGAARLLVETLSASNHRLATAVVWPLGLLALGLALGVIAATRDARGFTALGIATVFAAIPAALLGFGLMGGLLVAGSDGSTLAEEMAAALQEISRLPLRNALALAVAGLAIAVPATLATLIVSRLQRDRRELAR